MDDVFAPMPPEGQEHQGENQQQPPAGQEQQPQPPQGGGEQQPPAGGEGGEQGAAPPAAGTQPTTVPLAALEAERKGRQDWKSRADRAEAELEVLRRQQQQSQGQPSAQQPPDPVQAQYQRLENVVLNASERAARRDHGSETVDKAWARVQQEFSQNPSLYQQIVGAPDPWDQVVQHGKKLLALDEIGADPVAYRKKVEDEVRASLATAAPQPQTPAAPPLPNSLAGARSAGARGTTYTGPTPFENLFDR